ncbi:MAG: DNA-binding GntR family transcriptional regulator [Reinekea sp.]|jgi:DNA-binding GntR family transcriptional regulator
MLVFYGDNVNDLVLTHIDDLTGSLAQRVYQSLQEAILSMRLPPGTVLRKTDICDQLGVSRSPVAEAFARLSADRLVDIIPQSATRVSVFSMEEIREACFLREAIEVAVIGRVAQFRSEEQFMLLRRALRLQQLLVEDGDFEGFYQADEHFHSLLMDFCGFPGVATVAAGIALRLSRARILVLPEEGRAQAAVQEHQRILASIELKDPTGAQAAMKDHLAQLLNRIEPLQCLHPSYFRLK